MTRQRWLILGGLTLLVLTATRVIKPRGIRNHNPGNIRRGENWQGMAPIQTDPAFVQFEGPEWGIRAMARVLRNYGRFYGLTSVSDIISRWAPSNENATDSYIAAVAEALEVWSWQPIDIDSRLPDLIAAIIHHENGQQPYSADTIALGIKLADS